MASVFDTMIWPRLVGPGGSEGGYSDRPLADDPGGKTKYGITEAVAREEGYKGDMRDLAEAFAREIARRRYWEPYQCDQLPSLIAFQVFDAAYNGGHPAQWLQRSLGVNVDGKIGAVTIAAARAADPLKFAVKFNRLRLDYMRSLGNFKPNASGWVSRLWSNVEMCL